MEFELTEDEKKAIRALKRLEKIWPETLWIFAGDGNLTILRHGKNGEQVMDHNSCVDQNYIVDKVTIDSDGGGW